MILKICAVRRQYSEIVILEKCSIQAIAKLKNIDPAFIEKRRSEYSDFDLSGDMPSLVVSEKER